MNHTTLQRIHRVLTWSALLILGIGIGIIAANWSIRPAATLVLAAVMTIAGISGLAVAYLAYLIQHTSLELEESKGRPHLRSVDREIDQKAD